MSTFFLQRGIRLPVTQPQNLHIKDLDLPDAQGSPALVPEQTSSGRFATDFKEVAGQQPPLHLTLHERIALFLKEKGQNVVVRLADEDPFSLTQRAVTESLKKEPESVKEALALLAEKTGVKNVTFAANKRQDIGELGKLAQRVLRI